LTYSLLTTHNPAVCPTRKKVAMSAAKDCPSSVGRPLFRREDLAFSIGLVLEGGAQAADVLARLFEELGQGMEGGLRGMNDTREALAEAVEICYLHSEAHAEAVKLYRLAVEGHLRAEDEPVRLLRAAVERGAAKAAASKAERGR
jgi:hypothetical protein